MTFLTKKGALSCLMGHIYGGPVIPRKGFSVLPRLSRSLETIQFPLRQSAYSWLIHARSCANSVQFYGDSWHGVLYARPGQAYRGTALEAAWASHRGRSPSPCMATTSQIVCLVCEGSDSINSMLLARDFQQRMGKQPQQRGL